MPTRVKICGITQPDDAALAAELGADAIGLNFVGGPRRITGVQTAARIFWTLRDDGSAVPRIDIVVLVDIDQESPNEPWHGKVAHFPYSADAYQVYCKNYGRLAAPTRLKDEKWWMVAPIRNCASFVDLQVFLALNSVVPTAILLDAASEKLGGSGRTFNWHWIAEARAAGELDGLPPIILAGGLTPDNVANAIRIAKPYAVDVSSGVEIAGQPGIKDPIKLRDFIQAAKSAVP